MDQCDDCSINFCYCFLLCCSGCYQNDNDEKEEGKKQLSHPSRSNQTPASKYVQLNKITKN